MEGLQILAGSGASTQEFGSREWGVGGSEGKCGEGLGEAPMRGSRYVPARCTMRRWVAFPEDKQQLRPHLGPHSSLRPSFLRKDDIGLPWLPV